MIIKEKIYFTAKLKKRFDDVICQLHRKDIKVSDGNWTCQEVIVSNCNYAVSVSGSVNKNNEPTTKDMNVKVHYFDGQSEQASFEIWK